MDHIPSSLLQGVSILAVAGLLADKAINVWKGRSEGKANNARATQESATAAKATAETAKVVAETATANTNAESSRNHLYQELMDSVVQSGQRLLQLQNAVDDLREQNEQLRSRVKELERVSAAHERGDADLLAERDALRLECARLHDECDENKREVLVLRAEVERLRRQLTVAISDEPVVTAGE